MTREEHFELYKEHNKKAMAALRECSKDGYGWSWDKWNEYKVESKLANKHWGISQAMRTKQIKKLYSNRT